MATIPSSQDASEARKKLLITLAAVMAVIVAIISLVLTLRNSGEPRALNPEPPGVKPPGMKFTPQAGKSPYETMMQRAEQQEAARAQQRQQQQK